MSKINDGGPAFPLQRIKNANDEVCQWEEPGMALRDWFAGHALAGILAAPGLQPDDSSRSGCAELAYEFSDAMLAARHKKPEVANG